MNLSPHEHLKLHGTLPLPLLEDLIDFHERAKDAPNLTAYLQEARGSYPAEDFLAVTIERLRQLSHHMRGQNHTDLLAIIEDMDDLAQTTFYAADYGRDELRKAEAALAALKEVAP